MSEYIKSLRQHLGHSPLLQVGASVIVINQAGQMLMQQRTDCGSWGYSEKYEIELRTFLW